MESKYQSYAAGDVAAGQSEGQSEGRDRVDLQGLLNMLSAMVVSVV